MYSNLARILTCSADFSSALGRGGITLPGNRLGAGDSATALALQSKILTVARDVIMIAGPVDAGPAEERPARAGQTHPGIGARRHEEEVL
jgi:hypothetical protein